MDRAVIEVSPHVSRKGDWVVRYRRQVRGAFTDSAPAVSYACELAARLRDAGAGAPRVLVRFAPAP